MPYAASVAGRSGSWIAVLGALLAIAAVSAVAIVLADTTAVLICASLIASVFILLDFRVGDPQKRVREKLDAILQHTDRNPNTQGCLDLGMGRSGVDTILNACRSGTVKALLLQGPELLPLDADTAVLASDLKAEARRRKNGKGFSLIDGIGLATARTRGLPMLTMDAEFEGFEGVTVLGR